MIEIANIIRDVVRDTHVPMAEKVFGEEGLNAIFKVMETVQALYRHVDPERIRGQVLVFRAVDQADAGTVQANDRPADFAALANQNIHDLFLEVGIDGNPYARELGTTTKEELAAKAVVYHYQASREEFLAGVERRPVPPYDQSARSQFSVPTFSNLRQALERYAVENVRESTCYVFRRVWKDENRLFLIIKPESLMRDSLTQFLNNRIGGDHDVWPEQKVNESDPVDIRVQPRFQTNRLMLIEIKWMGDCADDTGHVTWQPRDARAQQGANQLADYLDKQRRTAPSHVIQGYYVIIDARRKGLPKDAKTAGTITRENGLYYENRELQFDPAPHLTRVPADFDRPYRMFARPVCSD
jgi:hypothetical protein